jgi:serine/threonine protein kinase
VNELDIFSAALELPSPEERACFLDQACADDRDLRCRIEELLASHAHAASFMNAPAPAQLATIDEPIAEGPGTVIGPYKLMEQIGEGGMGLVFVAEQQQPVRRKVALKVIKPGMDTRQVIARFEAERQALALMDHPNIAKVLDGGETATSRPFFVMELVKGVPITEYCDQNQVPVRERLELFGHVCQAVQHAHQKGIIHRDIKPSNVLIMSQDGTPLVKVIDFGVAKAIGQQLTDKTVYTQFAQLIGTPLYMSPEQAGESGVDVDTRSDIYSLGVLLYELLTGTTPFEERFKQVGYDEIRRIIREEEPPKPSARISTLGQASTTISTQRKSDPKRLSKLIRGELDWIVMKALEKDRNRRYETASAFAADVQRYLNDEPVLACPPSLGYRLRKFGKRNKVALVVASVVALALLAGTAVATWQAFVATHAKEEALAAAKAENQAKEDAQSRETETNAVLKFVEDKIFAAARPKDQVGGLGYDVKLADAVKGASLFVEKNFTGQPLIEARLRMTLGTSFGYLGDAKTAIEQFQVARELYTEHRGPEHPDTLRSMMGLANSYADAGRTQEALQLRDETLQFMKTKLGPDDDDTLRSMNNLADSYVAAGRSQEAITLLEETLQLYKAKLGPDQPETIKCMGNLALAFAAAGRTQEAHKLHEETLRLIKAKFGPDHPDTLISMHNLAFSYAAAGRTEEALKLHEETLQLQKAKLGPDHPDTLKSMMGLANSYADAGRTQEALQLREETLQLQKAKLGPDHRDTLLSMNNLAESYRVTGRTQEALNLQEETLQIRKAKLGPDHPDTLISMHNLATSHAAAGRTQEALQLRDETLRLMKAKLGPDHPITLTAMGALANSYAEAGRAQQALKLKEDTLQLRKAKLGPDHPDTLASMNNLANSYMAVEEDAKALAILLDTLTLRQLRAKAEPGNTKEQSFLAWTHGQMGQAEQFRRDYAAAVQAYARSVEMFEKLDGAQALKDHFFRGKLKLYRERLALCQKAEQAVKDLDFALRQPAPEVPELLDMRVRFLLKKQNLPAAVETAAKIKDRAGYKAEQLYDAACAYALCAGAAKNPSPPTPLFQGAIGDKLAEDAMALLKQAVAKGYKDAAHMKVDKDLYALHPREDFKKLLAELEAGRGSK